MCYSGPMKFVTASEHRAFFQKQRAIEFEGLLSQDQVDRLNESIDSVLAEQLNVPIKELSSLSPGRLFMAGRDLWRLSADVKKIIMQKQLAEVASELAEQRFMRLGYDQLLPELPGRIYKTSISDAYHKILNSSLTLTELSSLEGVSCGLMLCLKSDNSGSAEEKSVFSKMTGHAVFFQPDLPLNFQFISEHPLHRYLLIVYARGNAFYKRNDADPHTHALKQLDYAFGQKLSDKWHPMVRR